MAAYRAGAKLQDHQNSRVCDFTRRRGVAHSEILLPAGAAPFLADREKLWNYVERMEARQDAQLAREINFALPHELDAVQRRELVLTFVREAFVSRGMVADVAIHEPVAGKGDDPRNHHAHVMLTLRQATRTGLRPVKTREWNSPETLKQWRAMWADRQNHALELARQGARVDHRTLGSQRDDALARRDRLAAAVLDRVPEIHIGPKARKASRTSQPISRDRLVGPRRRRADGASVRRTIRYSRIDGGSRLTVNAHRVERNVGKLSRHIAHWQGRGARVQRRRTVPVPSKGPSRAGQLRLLDAVAAMIAALLQGLFTAQSARLARLHALQPARPRRRGRARARRPSVRPRPSPDNA